MQRTCARCGKPANGNCSECGENLCDECAGWVQDGVDVMCRACKEEADLPEDTYVPYHLYRYSFAEALSMSIVGLQDKLSQAQWRTLTLEQQEAILDEWENNETIKEAWTRLSELYRNVASRKQEKQAEEEDGKDV